MENLRNSFLAAKEQKNTIAWAIEQTGYGGEALAVIDGAKSDHFKVVTRDGVESLLYKDFECLNKTCNHISHPRVHWVEVC